jgi:hypothetical protein
MNRVFIVALLLCIGLEVFGTRPEGTKGYNLLTFKQIDVENTWFQTGNVAGLTQMPLLFPSEIKLKYGSTDGSFHSIFNGKSNQEYEFSSRGFRKSNQTFLYGSFGYRRSLEKGLNYTDTNDPAQNYPYLLADTIGNDAYNREFFNLSGMVASHLTSKIYWGLGFNYQVGNAVQNRDPRPENKVMKMNISPGLLLEMNNLNIGANLIYAYYDEDIDVSVVEQGVQQTMFQLYGLGIYQYHSSSSFYRLYRQQQVGGGLQIELEQNRISNLLNSNYSYFQQTIDDGRRGNMATWAAVKNDSKIDGINWDLSDVFSLKQGRKLHQLSAIFHLTNKLGTEFIQRLEEVGNAGMEQWETYGEIRKYYSLETLSALDYKLMSKDEDNMLKALFCTGLGYRTFDEKYYLPNLEERYSNLDLKASFLKLYKIGNGQILGELKFKYQFNIDRKQTLDAENFIVQKIFLPEYAYLTKDFISPGMSISYQFPLSKTYGRYFVKADFDWFHAEKTMSRTVFNFSTGIIF